MSRVEQYIQEHTRNCSNKLDYVNTTCKVYQPWLTPDQARKAVEIAREEIIEKACKWLRENKDKYLYNTGEKGEYIPTCSDNMIDDFRKYMESE